MLDITTDQGRVQQTLGGNLKTRSAVEWVSDETIPDPVIPKVLNEWVVVRPIGITDKVKTKSGFEFYVPEQGRERQESALTIGKVVGLGEYAGIRPNTSRPEIGDYVLFPKYAGNRVDYNGVKVVFLYDDTLLAVVDKDLQHGVTKGI